jgi:uncharacterized protein involved in cysteine biosynthesis
MSTSRFPLADFFLPLKTVGLVLGNRRLFFYSFIPSVLALILVVFSWDTVYDAVRNWMPAEGVEGWKSWGAWLYKAVAFFSSLIVSGILWMAAGNILLLPFVDTIIDASQKRCKGTIFLAPLPFSFARLCREVFHSIKIYCLLLCAIGFLLIPFAGAIISFCLSAIALTLLTIMPLFERLDTPFKERLRRLRQCPFNCLAYGLGLWLLLYIPIVNIFVLGIAQASAVPFWLRHEDVLGDKKVLEEGRKEQG